MESKGGLNPLQKIELETQARSSASTVCILNKQAISPTPKNLLKIFSQVKGSIKTSQLSQHNRNERQRAKNSPLCMQSGIQRERV